MEIELILSEVKQLSDEEIAVILDRLDAEKATLLTECLDFCLAGNDEAAYDYMEQYNRVAKLRDFVRSICPVKVPAKHGDTQKLPRSATCSSTPRSAINCKPVVSSWELYEQNERRV